MSNKRPNLVLILTDHWRGNSLGRPENLSDGERLKTGNVAVWRAPEKNII
jgi:hypothetical protein